MAYAYPQQSMWSGGRLVALLGAIAVNLGMILAIGLGLRFDDLKPKFVDLELVDVPTAPVNEEPMPIEIPAVELPAEPQPVTLDVPLPEIEIETTTEPAIAAEPIPQPARPIAQPAATQLQASSTLSPPVYPPQSIRAGEQGTVTLLIYVLPDGRVGEVKVAKSSGHPRLDQSAMQAARGGWRFKAATQGGAAVAAWGRYAVTFNLRDAQ